jgi:hypothetical protein
MGVPPDHPFGFGFSSINRPFWDTPILGNLRIYIYRYITLVVGLPYITLVVGVITLGISPD